MVKERFSIGPRTEEQWMDHCLGLREGYGILRRRYNERAKQGKMGVIYPGGKGEIPVLYATGRGLAEAWENAMISLWNNGGFIRTQYDRHDPKSGLYVEGPSMDSTMVWVIEDPLSEPMIHKDFPGGLDILEEYVQEVVDGVKNHWVRDPKNPDDKRWEYTYNGRVTDFTQPGLREAAEEFIQLFGDRAYEVPALEQMIAKYRQEVSITTSTHPNNQGKIRGLRGVIKDLEEIKRSLTLRGAVQQLDQLTKGTQEYEPTLNQFEIVAQNLAKSPITRRAQFITWKPYEDLSISDPACFQSNWVRGLRSHPRFTLYSDETTGELKLNPNIRFRSWDSYGASFMNMFAFIKWNKKLAERVSELKSEPVSLGRVALIGDSFHIYYKDFHDFLGRFAKALHQRHFYPREDNDPKARTWNSNSDIAQAMFESSRMQLPGKIAEQDAKYAQGKELTKDSAQIFKDEKDLEQH